MLVRPAGFEPTTPWFVAKYSIQLSYGRWKDEKYSKIFVFCKNGSDHTLRPRPYSPTPTNPSRKGLQPYTLPERAT